MIKTMSLKVATEENVPGASFEGEWYTRKCIGTLNAGSRISEMVINKHSSFMFSEIFPLI